MQVRSLRVAACLVVDLYCESISVRHEGRKEKSAVAIERVVSLWTSYCLHDLQAERGLGQFNVHLTDKRFEFFRICRHPVLIWGFHRLWLMYVS